MDVAIKPLIANLRATIPMLVRTAPASEDYLEGVLSREALQRCYALLSDALGAPVKAFDQPVQLESRLQKVVVNLGGIRTEQCLFLKAGEQERAVYAALWPWASDQTRITLKVGVCKIQS